MTGSRWCWWWAAFLLWKGVKELRVKLKGVEDHLKEVARFGDVVAPSWG